MNKFTEWVSGKFQQPLSPMFFLCGALLVVGLTAGIKLPGIGALEAAQSYRWPTLGFGVIFVLLAILIERGLLASTPFIEEIHPDKIQAAGKEYAQNCNGERHWFNVPLGRCIPPLFDGFLKPAIANPKVTRILFMLDKTVRPIWVELVRPAIEDAEESLAHVRSKVTASFHDLKNVSPVRCNMAFRIISISRPNGRKPEAHVFFYDKSWMSKIPVAGRDELIPKLMIKVKPGSGLFVELHKLCEEYCFEASDKSDRAGPLHDNGRTLKTKPV